MDEYFLTQQQFHSLAGGYGTTDAIELLVDSQIAKRRLLLLAACEQVPSLCDGIMPLLDRLDREAPSAMRRLLRHPFLEAWFADLSTAGQEHRLSYLAGLAASAAAVGGLPFDLQISSPGADLTLPILGRAVGIGAGPVTVSFDGTCLQIAGAVRTVRTSVPFTEPAAAWRPIPVIPSLGQLDDVDTYRDRFAPAQPLDRATAGFAGVIRAGWDLLLAEQPDHAAAIRSSLVAVVPLCPPDDGSQLSASARGCFGAIGMSPADASETVAELLVHEFQHEKLTALLELVDLCHPGGPPRYYAPWRLDPRPALSLIQGVYAFAGVVGFWRIRRIAGMGERADRLFAFWREQVSAVLEELLGSGHLTDHGERFFSVLSETLAVWCEEPVPGRAATAARMAVLATRIQWRLTNHVVAEAEEMRLAQAWTRGKSRPRLSGTPVVAAGPPSGAQLGTVLLERGGDSIAQQALLAGDYTTAAQAASAEPLDWVMLIAALAAESHVAVARRPELIRAVYHRLDNDGRGPDPAALLRWFG